MSEKTIPQLNPISTITENALFIVDTGTETFRMTSQNLALFVAQQILPPGMLIPYAAATAPSGWLLADGSAVSRTTYARLFAAIGTTYGTGDGSTTFNLPDMRGRVAAGKDDMGGSAASRITNALSGFVGSTLGAAGGTQSRTPAGTIGGSQSIAHTHTLAHTHTIAHTHTMAHTHNFAHAHMWSTKRHGPNLQSLSSLDASLTDISLVRPVVIGRLDWVTNSAGSINVATSTSTTDWYTTGALGAPSGSGSTATSGAASTSTTSAASVGDSGAASNATTSAMSANATVNGSNFTFTGTAQSSVQPTLITNYIIRV